MCFGSGRRGILILIELVEHGVWRGHFGLRLCGILVLYILIFVLCRPTYISPWNLTVSDSSTRPMCPFSAARSTGSYQDHRLQWYHRPAGLGEAALCLEMYGYLDL